MLNVRRSSVLERRTLERCILGSNPTDGASKRGQFHLSQVAQVSRDASSVSEKDGSRSEPKRSHIKPRIKRNCQIRSMSARIKDVNQSCLIKSFMLN